MPPTSPTPPGQYILSFAPLLNSTNYTLHHPLSPSHIVPHASSPQHPPPLFFPRAQVASLFPPLCNPSPLSSTNCPFATPPLYQAQIAPLQPLPSIKHKLPLCNLSPLSSTNCPFAIPPLYQAQTAPVPTPSQYNLSHSPPHLATYPLPLFTLCLLDCHHKLSLSPPPPPPPKTREKSYA